MTDRSLTKEAVGKKNIDPHVHGRQTIESFLFICKPKQQSLILIFIIFNKQMIRGTKSRGPRIEWQLIGQQFLEFIVAQIMQYAHSEADREQVRAEGHLHI